MNGFMTWLQTKFVPKAAKVSNQRHLVAIRDSFIAMLPITMVGSIAVLLNFTIVPKLPAAIATPIRSVNGVVWWGSLAILSVVFVIALGYNLAKAYGVDPLAGALISFASFLVFIPQSATVGEVSQWGLININYFGANGIFPAMVIGMISTIIYSKLMLNKVTIKLPDSVPPAVNKAFASIIPGIVTIYIASTISYLVSTYTGQALNDLIVKYIQQPLLGLSQGLVSVIIITFFIQFFWFFGLHGHNVLAPVIDGLYMPALLANVEHMAKGGLVENLPYLWTRGSFDAYIQMGGSGITIALIISILIFSKRRDHRTVAKLGLPMGIFNINEPMIFGMPIVLNPLYIIPFVLIPVIGVVIGYLATAAGIVPPVYVQVPWITPPVLMAYLATGGSVMAALVSLINLVIAFIIWTPFVIIANNIKEN
ncbi:PTS sugar transporter subunit IIC [Oceanivirga miroungae]|uniref:Permease IIC component n=1 Tax=Oceanivirga miroungae TaxID=1130046 RepID=A0A6I8MDM2_9FUSO|nr:PTS sugar transporter subunit IIC [Oceanivirga miroungae]VWL85191.1 PTS system cellobiose-specific transporter subunit IIC [Oceanivirga miroungae]